MCREQWRVGKEPEISVCGFSLIAMMRRARECLCPAVAIENVGVAHARARFSS